MPFLGLPLQCIAARSVGQGPERLAAIAARNVQGMGFGVTRKKRDAGLRACGLQAELGDQLKLRARNSCRAAEPPLFAAEK